MDGDDWVVIHEELPERFNQRTKRRNERRDTPQVEQQEIVRIANPEIRRYYQTSIPDDQPDWLKTPAIPNGEEILRSEQPELDANCLQGTWGSKDAYLKAHYGLLREDATGALRDGANELKDMPNTDEEYFDGKYGIYEKTFIIGYTPSTRGFAVRITFSTRRANRKIIWEQSKRLTTGTLVVLSPKSDMFKKHAVVATVAARPLSNLELNPPEIDLFFSSPADVEIDPGVEYVMLESRSSYFEATKHTLLALQKMMLEQFPLEEHLVDVVNNVDSPVYLLTNSHLDVTSVFPDTSSKVDVLQEWPQLQSQMDHSQIAALRRILTKRLAIVQGPPGTGKTYTTVQALKIMLANRQPDDPPILVTCQTNHALDQLLRHVADFEPDFARLGGRTKDRDVVAKRTVYELGGGRRDVRGSIASQARRTRESLAEAIGILLKSLERRDSPLDHGTLEKYEVLTAAQCKSLEEGAARWVRAGDSNPFRIWLSKALKAVPQKPQPENFGFAPEDTELEIEQLKELEAENGPLEEERSDSLRGTTLSLSDNFVGNASDNNDRIVELYKSQPDLWKIPPGARPVMYNHYLAGLKAAILPKLRHLVADFDRAARDCQIGTWERQETILREQKVIGLTTTGLSKYRGMISALKCKVVLVEEAAEILEAPVIAACLPSLEHLILVGDHKQLRPSCDRRALQESPYYLNVSLFERMMINNFEHTTLTSQRRMIPEVRRILFPIYGDIIQDHQSVTDKRHRPSVPGMGGINSFWFTHQWIEQRDSLMSCVNENEADMVIGFVEYLLANGVNNRDITILTFYNGQRKAIVRRLFKSVKVAKRYPIVVTVDSYQGEENKIVILSLVRSNSNKSIGFLGIDNRVCVALSRAQCGFYIFGNATLLQKNKTWAQVIRIMHGGHKKDELPAPQPQRFDRKLPLLCSTHGRLLKIDHASDWEYNCGGCDQKCKTRLGCGHECPLLCHPYRHDQVICKDPACVNKKPEVWPRAINVDAIPLDMQNREGGVQGNADVSIKTVVGVPKQDNEQKLEEKVADSARRPSDDSLDLSEWEEVERLTQP